MPKEYIELARARFEFERFFKGKSEIQADCDSLLCMLSAADVVKVVRCRDCKHSSEDDFDGSLWCCRDGEREVPENHFCSYGERKDE